MRTTTVRCPHCGKANRIPVAAEGRPKCGNCHNALPWIVDASDEDFSEVAEKAEPFVLVDMWATWCGPCRMVSPALEQLATEFAGEVKLVKVDVDRSPKLSQRFEIRAVPTLLVMHHGEVIERQAGAAPAPVLRTWLRNAIDKAKPKASTSDSGGS